MKENHLKKTTENAMDTGIIWEVIRGNEGMLVTRTPDKTDLMIVTYFLVVGQHEAVLIIPQEPNNHKLTQHLYYHYYYQNPGSQLWGT